MPGTMNFHAEIGCFCGSINATELTCCMVIFRRVYKSFLARFSNALCQLLHVRKRTTSFFAWCGKSSTAAWENYKGPSFPLMLFLFFSLSDPTSQLLRGDTILRILTFWFFSLIQSVAMVCQRWFVYWFRQRSLLPFPLDGLWRKSLQKVN